MAVPPEKRVKLGGSIFSSLAALRDTDGVSQDVPVAAAANPEALKLTPLSDMQRRIERTRATLPSFSPDEQTVYSIVEYLIRDARMTNFCMTQETVFFDLLRYPICLWPFTPLRPGSNTQLNEGLQQSRLELHMPAFPPFISLNVFQNPHSPGWQVVLVACRQSRGLTGPPAQCIPVHRRVVEKGRYPAYATLGTVSRRRGLVGEGSVQSMR